MSALFAGQKSLTALTARSITAKSRLLAELTEVRARGYAINLEESEEGVASVAVAVRGPQLVPVAALVVSAPVSRMTEAAAAKAVAELRDRAGWLEAQWIEARGLEARGLEAQLPGAGLTAFATTSGNGLVS